ncbi:TetR family transcriptional regulator [Aeromicrobium chenweiae]|uniref:TetR family transcriptional regulator n=1 Tax=Aeromicrobium chenweiae TaxID=2079793 RepID=A0A2S0WJI0_9ACTN|nr:TetR family transcriptional regulator [Aeromicrobium chenweiae]AWB91390.1 TetR family transcriptional regulator [Aeromicrobium chenweiae]TGN30679.1 TetR/AcrR family transcriptional regulator [Aeromicrobium chenweiae]
MTAASGTAGASPVRERLLDAAHDVIESTGWSTVTMAGIAEAAGVSRQTVYNEFGTKHGLAEQLALRELDRFLGVVRQRMADADDLVEGIRAACEGALEMGQQSVLVRTVVGSLPGEQDTDLLQILTTESGEIVEAAVMVVRQSIDELFPATPLTSDELEVAVESVVRLVLSALTRPSKSPADAAADIAWIVGLALRGAAAAD